MKRVGWFKTAPDIAGERGEVDPPHVHCIGRGQWGEVAVDTPRAVVSAGARVTLAVPFGQPAPVAAKRTGGPGSALWPPAGNCTG